MKRDLGDVYELEDYPESIDREAGNEYLGGESYWATGR